MDNWSVWGGEMKTLNVFLRDFNTKSPNKVFFSCLDIVLMQDDFPVVMTALLMQMQCLFANTQPLLLWAQLDVDCEYNGLFTNRSRGKLPHVFNLLQSGVWQIVKTNDFDLPHCYLCSTSSQYPSLREAWTTPSPCHRSRWHVCSPTPSSAPSPAATPEGMNTATTQTSTSSGKVWMW